MKRVLVLASLTGYCFWISFATGVAFVGEGWFVQVIHRVASGETLYRDVTYGAGPLPVFLASALARLIGGNVLLLKALVASVWAATIWMGIETLRESGCSVPIRAGYVLSCLLFAPTPLSPLYQVMATMFMVAAYRLAVHAVFVRAEWPLMLAALCAGLSAASKQNVGVYAMAALLLCSLGIAGPTRHRLFRGGQAARVILAFALGALLPFTPAVVQAGPQAVWENVAGNKGAYVSLGAISFSAALVDAVQKLWAAHLAAKPSYARQALGFLIAPTALLIPLCARLLSSSQNSPALVPIACFSVGAFAGIFPRADRVHVTYMLPVLLIGFWWGAAHLPTVGAARFRIATGVFLRYMLVAGAFIVLLGNVLWPGMQWLRGERTCCGLPGFSGPLVPTRQERRLERIRTGLLCRVSGHRVFFLSPRAGFWYRTLGLTNPTTVDFPYRTLLTPERQRRIAAALTSGEVDLVAVEAVDSPLWPQRLEARVRAELQLEHKVGPVSLFAVKNRAAVR